MDNTLILILIFNNSFGRIWTLPPRPKRNEFIVEKGTMDSLSHGASKLKAIKDTKGFNNRGEWGGEGRGWRLFRQVCSRVISQMDFALLCRKLHATLYFPFSRRDDVSLVSLTPGSPPPFRSINLLKFNVGRILLLFLYFIIRPADKLGSEAVKREKRGREILIFEIIV